MLGHITDLSVFVYYKRSYTNLQLLKMFEITFHKHVAYLKRLVRRLFLCCCFSLCHSDKLHARLLRNILDISFLYCRLYYLNWQGVTAHPYLSFLGHTYDLSRAFLLLLLALRRIASFCGSNLALAEPHRFCIKSVCGVCDELIPMRQTETCVSV